MSVPPSATFSYVTTVPEGGTRSLPWVMKSLEPITPRGAPLFDNRLVGWEPKLFISDAGMTPNPGPTRPAVLRSELRLVATDKRYASQESVSYHLDRELIRVLQPGDVFHMAQTGSLGFAASAIRRGKLIFAVGQVTAVPLGAGITVRIPVDLLMTAEGLFRKRDPGFEFPLLPLEVRCDDKSRIVYAGEVRMGGYHVRVEQGFRVGCPGVAESVAISLDEACDWVAASASAQLLRKRGDIKNQAGIPKD